MQSITQNPIFRKTFGGITRQYYLRHFAFGLAFLLFILYVVFIYEPTNPDTLRQAESIRQVAVHEQIGKVLMVVVCTVLYPYARFVWESVAGFIMGNNVFILPLLFMMLLKVIGMTICWAGAIFIAPIGLAWLYYHHTKQEKAMVVSASPSAEEPSVNQ